MIKHVIALILISLLVILAMPYAQVALQALVSMHDWVSDMLTKVFSDGKAGDIIRQLLALLAVPLLVGFVPAFVYWLVKRSWFPYFMEFAWVTWLAQTSALIILYKSGI